MRISFIIIRRSGIIRSRSGRRRVIGRIIRVRIDVSLLIVIDRGLIILVSRYFVRDFFVVIGSCLRFWIN